MLAPHSIDSYPHPAVAVDIAVMTVTDAAAHPALAMLILTRQYYGGRSLPGGFIRERETVKDTVVDVLERKAGISLMDGAQPHLLEVFDDPRRDERAWTISIAHSVSISEAALRGCSGDLIRVSPEGQLVGEGALLFDHDKIVASAVREIRDRYEIRYRLSRSSPDPDGFLAEPFTLHQLRRVHEAVLGEELHKDNFNKRMKEFLEPVRDGDDIALAEGLRGRPATLYRKSQGMGKE